MKTKIPNYPIHIHEIVDGEDGEINWYAFLPDFGHAACSAIGNTPIEALKELDFVIQDVIAYYQDTGKPLPEKSRSPLEVRLPEDVITTLKHITYKLYIRDSRVYFQILDQDERSRSSNEDKLTLNRMRTSSGFLVVSMVSPDITSGTIFIRGSGKYDDLRINSHPVRSTKDGILFCNNAHKALKEWDENWEGWNKPSNHEVRKAPCGHEEYVLKSRIEEPKTTDTSMCTIKGKSAEQVKTAAEIIHEALDASDQKLEG